MYFEQQQPFPQQSPYSQGIQQNHNMEPPTQQQQQQGGAPLFGVMIPGQPVRTDFVQVDPSGMKYTLTMDVVHTSSVRDIAFFLLTTELPASHGAILYAQVSNSNSGYEIIGAVTSEKPSGIFRTNWNIASSNEDSNSDSSSMFDSTPKNTDSFTSISAPSTVTFGISIESTQNIANLEIINKGVEDRVVDVAKKIALNLFNYLQSFDDCNSSRRNGTMMVPVNVFERWITRFQNKYRIDPNFFMKTES